MRRSGIRVAAGVHGAHLPVPVLPIGVLVAYSFNAPLASGGVDRLTLDWYRELFDDFAIWAATSNSPS